MNWFEFKDWKYVWYLKCSVFVKRIIQHIQSIFDFSFSLRFYFLFLSVGIFLAILFMTIWLFHWLQLVLNLNFDIFKIYGCLLRRMKWMKMTNIFAELWTVWLIRIFTRLIEYIQRWNWLEWVVWKPYHRRVKGPWGFLAVPPMLFILCLLAFLFIYYLLYTWYLFRFILRLFYWQILGRCIHLRVLWLAKI